MNKRSFLALLLPAAVLGVSPAAFAQAEAPLPPVEGEVRRVDAAQGRITLRHGDIPNLDMGAMTMVFRVHDAAMLKDLKAGDKVRFTAQMVDGQLTVMSLMPMR
ncbi:copper-binding protein [Pseudacidovorax intermedius]|uniref:Cu/Ag efflux protein CusF n=1 Tax=Pseudacidovorax intermedius TaxID=433924 RepID=A0A370FIA0_9BURK|nr:copper-binding protein [Pseudacidovorax intermedius]RDI25141.1 Cu/Ag efflux protein CusF [Pseudacidovorax intermedius]